jgi:hypothetical protein
MPFGRQLKNKRYVWIAKWRKSKMYPNYGWSSYISIKKDLSDPKCMGCFHMKEHTAFEEISAIMEQWDVKYDFIVVEHPEKNKFLGNDQDLLAGDLLGGFQYG